MYFVFQTTLSHVGCFISTTYVLFPVYFMWINSFSAFFSACCCCLAFSVSVVYLKRGENCANATACFLLPRWVIVSLVFLLRCSNSFCSVSRSVRSQQMQPLCPTAVISAGTRQRTESLRLKFNVGLTLQCPQCKQQFAFPFTCLASFQRRLTSLSSKPKW